MIEETKVAFDHPKRCDACRAVHLFEAIRLIYRGHGIWHGSIYTCPNPACVQQAKVELALIHGGSE